MSSNFLFFQIIEPTERGLVERAGRYHAFAEAGLHFLIPFVDNVRVVNTTERIKDVRGMEYITKDRLNCFVDSQVYYRVKADEQSVKNSEYNVDDHEYQIVQLAATTLRGIFGSMTFEDANEKRGDINTKLMDTLKEETKDWGISIVRAEVKEIKPPQSVQDAMNKKIIAESEKKASSEKAEAAKIEASGFKEAAIEKAEGARQATVAQAKGDAEALKLRSEAQAKAIEVVNTAADKFFGDNAQKLKRLEVTQEILKDNAKVFLPTGQDLTLILGDTNILPVKQKREQ